MVPGEVLVGDQTVELNAGRPRRRLSVLNTGDRPVQVGSHFHLAEANAALDFDRQAARGWRLDVPAGTSVRFEPGDRKEVSIVPFAGARYVAGFRGLVAGPLDAGAPDPAPLDPAAPDPASLGTGPDQLPGQEDPDGRD
jgi:urease subunit beta